MKLSVFLFWLPNLITLGRLFLVPALVYFVMLGQVAAAFWIFVLAGVSDAVDGLLAKRLNSVTRLGTYLDPLADKALLVAAYVTLGMQAELPLWLVILVVSRDLMIVGGALLYQLIMQELNPRPLAISKLNTAMQIILVAVVLGQPGLGIALPSIVVVLLVWLTGITTLLSGAAYLITWGRQAIHSDSSR
ncbi:MAG TPA: CDP-alcohol phosphatidyltransferase family protein [Kiloniellales bacterium]|nr:CDP-alcohol phosphatidyltransferase family protein [Kiloniellales bacterium]